MTASLSSTMSPSKAPEERTPIPFESPVPGAPDAPHGPSERAVTVRVFLILLLAGLVGLLGALPSLLAIAPPRAPVEGPPLWLLLALSVLQNLALLAIVIAVGLWLGPRVGLGVPLLRAWARGDPAAAAQFRAQALPSALAGAAVAVVLLVLDLVVFAPRLSDSPSQLRGQAIAAWQALLAALYGGIVEELLLRLGLMTVLVWLGAKAMRARQPRPGVFWAANVATAVVFGLGHLPATAALVPITPLIVTRALLLNGIAGVVFGWKYWRQGLLAAMVTHASADVVIQTLGPLLLGRG